MFFQFCPSCLQSKRLTILHWNIILLTVLEQQHLQNNDAIIIYHFPSFNRLVVHPSWPRRRVSWSYSKVVVFPSFFLQIWFWLIGLRMSHDLELIAQHKALSLKLGSNKIQNLVCFDMQGHHDHFQTNHCLDSFPCTIFPFKLIGFSLMETLWDAPNLIISITKALINDNNPKSRTK